MKLILFISIIILVFNVFSLVQIWFASLKLIESHHGDLIDLDLLNFNNYLKQFKKSYSGEEFNTRLQYFKESLQEIAELNALEGTTVFGLTKFSDMHPKEFANIMLGARDTCINQSDRCHRHDKSLQSSNIVRTPLNNYNNDTIPSKFDWREHGCLSPVLDQKLCAACWAFSIVGVMECMAAKGNISRERLSIQELIDCSEESEGCRAGSVRQTLDSFCRARTNVTTEENYPLTLKDKETTRCNELSREKNGLKIKKYDYQCLANETDMLRLVAYHGPLITVINAVPLRNYFGGIVHRACYRNQYTKIFHALQIIGYDTTNNVPYYILKNSGGEDFGEDGYLRLAYNQNVCGVREEISYLDVE